MYCIHNTCTDIFFNLAAEEYLLKHSDKDFFILWKNDPAVVLGKHQNVFKEVNLDYVATHHIDIARRYSGGGTVYQDQGNINLTFIETSTAADFDKYTDWMMEALSSFKLSFTKDKRRGIYLNGLKISGSAQCIYKNRILYHATLLFDANLKNLSAALAAGMIQLETDKGAQRIFVDSVKSTVTNLANYLKHSVDVETFSQKVFSHFLQKDSSNQIYILSDEEISSINSLRETKYVKKEWNFNTL